MARIGLLLLLTLCWTAPVSAHEIHSGGGFMSGFNHPVLGFDHLLAMLSVGMLSTQLGGRAIWTVPLAFVTFMLVGGILGLYAIAVPFVEIGIALSVLLLGLAIAFDRQIPLLFAMAFVGVFAIFHGHAHGAEMPELASPVLYALGFLFGTAVIHLGGVMIGLGMQRMTGQRNLMRVTGAAIAAMGGYLLAGF
ncbi:HupE/UreJ family protein [Shewanella sp. SP2S2-4]|jgi:urease accessory protein|uniref:HupE/UreJ family protein n=1 Tax=Shewanella TaxID=22 RepID=UPI001D3F29AF|nr:MULTISPECIES: HupE/UreJ family protein [unclassified Shewanella]EGT3628047.1 HupE/UreJ family protein [Morganella morganii]MBU1392802.1 HupE/UreJ family protein [Gammaproteobacteria bacterium]MBU1477183.1 HupE/UreJ family protein [Gammaproteobacteria bacterium]MBU2001460.1 HupE/UreJ family protein [Gammaproteobacteria bacterium]MBU2131438.1 HupE/UreJ family protein [Gammaproteobacteria bacterium]